MALFIAKQTPEAGKRPAEEGAASATGTLRKGHGFSRRTFIKGGLAAAAAASSASLFTACSSSSQGGESQSGNEPDQIFSGVCRGNCAGGCFIDVHVRDGQVVRTTARDLPDTRYNRICSKGLTHVARIYSSRRVLYPMRRVGERGEGQFERITWDEAIDEIAEKWGGYIDEYGPASIGMQTGSGNYSVCSGNGFVTAMMRFRTGMGFATIGNQFDLAAYYGFNVLAGLDRYSYQNEPADMLNSDTIICWGANPTISQPQVMHFILDAKEKGAKYIVVDPAFNANTAKADKYIPVNASTDGVLAFGVIKLLIENGWIDEDFVRNHTTAPALIDQQTKKLLTMSQFGQEPVMKLDATTGQEAPYDPLAVYDEATGTIRSIDDAEQPAITGITDAGGIEVKTAFDNLVEIAAPYDFDKVEELTGVGQSDVEYLANEYHTTENINTYLMLGGNHYVNAHYNYWPIAIVSWLTGHVGKPGNACGWGEMEPSNTNLLGTAYMDANGNMLTSTAPSYNINAINEVLETGTYGGWQVSEPYDETKPASANVDPSKGGTPTTPLKSIYIMQSNAAANHADHSYAEKWLKNVEFLVVAEMSMTETAKYADILLPAAHWFEQEDMFEGFHTHPFYLLNEKAIEPLGEAKSDFDIMKMLASRLGHDEIFGDMSPEDMIKVHMESDALKASGATFEALMSDKVVRGLPENYVAYEGGAFNTSVGRALFYNDNPVPMYDVGQRIDYSKEWAPYWEPSIEADVHSKAREKFPFFLLSERMRTRTHSQWWDVGYLKEYEPEPIIKINPADAQAKGIADNDTVRVFNDRGSMTVKAHYHAGVPQGTLAAPRAWQAEEFIDGHLGSLPFNGYNQMVTNVCFDDVAVDIEKL